MVFGVNGVRILVIFGSSKPSVYSINNKTLLRRLVNMESGDYTVTTEFLFSTTAVGADLYRLDRYEAIFLISYELLCTVMTIVLNSYLIFIIYFKVTPFNVNVYYDFL